MLSCYLQGDACYACPTNKERNSIQKALFQKHINTTHPSITSNEVPPNHTLIIEANISSSVSKKSKNKIDRHLKNRILTTCGDADVMSGTKLETIGNARLIAVTYVKIINVLTTITKLVTKY